MARTPTPEARLLPADAGLKPEGDGWFVVNVADAVSVGAGDSHYGFIFEGERGAFPHVGINIRVLGPGSPAAVYHAEAGQEAFLVLDGECVLVVEEQERRLSRWDFVHCPPHTAHVLVGAGEAPCVVLMVGARSAGRDLIYPTSPAAAKYGASAARDTTDPAEAYAGWARPRPRRSSWPLA